MKKFLSIFIALTLCLSVAFAVACGGNGDTDKDVSEKATLNVYAPDGAPAVGIAKFIADKEDFGTGAEITYNVVAANSIGQVVQQGKGDIVVMPVNAASKLYAVNSSDPYKMAGVITHGNLYIMSKDDLGLEDLKGKVVGVIGQGNVPDLTFRAVLKNAGLEYEASETAIDDKVALKYFQDASELIPSMKQGVIAVGLLPEPAANKLVSMNAGFKYALDLQELYDAENKTYPQAVVMIKSSVLEKYNDIAKNFGDKVAEAVTWAKNDPAACAEAVKNVLTEGVTASLSAANLNATVIDNCKIYWQRAADAKVAVTEYINAIMEIAPTAAKAVADDFFA